MRMYSPKALRDMPNFLNLAYLLFIVARAMRLFPTMLVCSLFFITPLLRIPLQAQTSDTTYHILKQLPLAATFLTTDALQQIYIATEEGQVLKLDKNGTLLFEYNNKRLGRIGTIDATNPFTILVYYPGLATIILLDRTLSPIKEINLFDLAIFEPQAVAMANDNNIWLYDPINYQLNKINRTGKIIFQSRRFTQLIPSPIQPTFLLERNNQLLLTDADYGIFIFDGFGQLKQQLPIVGVHQFQVFNNQLVYFKEGALKRFSLDVLEEAKVVVPFNMEEVETISMMKGQFLLTKKTEVLIVEILKN